MRPFSWLKSFFTRTKTFSVRLRAMLGGTLPTPWLSNPVAEVEAYQGWLYCAAEALAKQVSQAELTVTQAVATTPAKALAPHQAQAGPTTSLPVGHPLVKLLRRPNREQSLATFLRAVSDQLTLHGECLVWTVRDTAARPDSDPLAIPDDTPRELYVVPKYVTSWMPPSAQYPLGAYRVSPGNAYAAGINTDTVDEEGFGPGYGTLLFGGVIDARDVKRIYQPSPQFPGQGFSPVTAGGLWHDLALQMDQARWSVLRNAIVPSIILEETENVEPLTFEQRQQLDQRMREKQQTPANFSNYLLIPTGTKLAQAGRTALELDFANGYPQIRDSILAAHGVPLAALGGVGTSDAAFFTAMQAFVDLTVQPRLNLIAEELTKEFNDQAKRAVKVQYLAQNSLATINEIRALDHLPPVPWGDVPPKQFEASLEALKSAPRQPAQTAGPDRTSPDELDNHPDDEGRPGVRNPGRDQPAGKPRSDGSLTHLPAANARNGTAQVS
jgi:phage portal protein BeeE